MSQVVHLQLSEFWTQIGDRASIRFFVFDDLRSMATHIKLVTTNSTKKFLTFEKVGKLRSYGIFTQALHLLPRPPSDGMNIFSFFWNVHC